MLDKHAIYIDEAFVGRARVPAKLFLKRDLGSSWRSTVATDNRLGSKSLIRSVSQVGGEKPS